MTTPRTSAAVLAAGLLSPFALTLAALTAPAVAASDPVPGVPDAPGAPAGASGGAVQRVLVGLAWLYRWRAPVAEQGMPGPLQLHRRDQ